MDICKAAFTMVTGTKHVRSTKYIHWWVVWNPFFFIYWEASSQLTFIFFRGVGIPPTSWEWLPMFLFLPSNTVIFPCGGDLVDGCCVTAWYSYPQLFGILNLHTWPMFRGRNVWSESLICCIKIQFSCTFSLGDWEDDMANLSHLGWHQLCQRC